MRVASLLGANVSLHECSLISFVWQKQAAVARCSTKDASCGPGNLRVELHEDFIP